MKGFLMNMNNTGAGPKVAVIMGTRPEIIKMAPVVHALRDAGLTVEVIHSGQHDVMAWPIYDFFGIELDHVLDLRRNQVGLGGLAGELLGLLNAQLHAMAPDAVLVHGDTSSAAMGAMAAVMGQWPIAHVEAGLRSGSMTEPFPEEINRSLIGRVARWHFAPTELAKNNLLREAVDGDIHVVGNTVVDAVLLAAERVRESLAPHASLAWWRASGLKQLVVVTAHRRENWGQPMSDIAQSVSDLLARHPDAGVVWPLHINPAIQALVREAHTQSSEAIRSRWHLCDPLDYPHMVALMDEATLLLTDSGGIQEEGLSLGKPILVMRDVTERPEVISCGMGQLVGTQPERIASAVARLLEGQQPLPSLSLEANPFGNGTTAKQIAQVLQADLGVSAAAEVQAALG